MKSEPGMSQREADDLLLLMGDDKEMRSKLAKVLESELRGSAKKVVQDVGRLRR